jgi:hypothetical protein
MPSGGAAGGLRWPAAAAVFGLPCGGRSGMHLSSARRRPGGRMTTPCRLSVAWHVPVRGPLEFHGTPEDAGADGAGPRLGLR